MTGPPIGRQSTVKFLATADLGHAQTDGSTEIDHEQGKDDLNTTPEGTLQYVSICHSSLHFTWPQQDPQRQVVLQKQLEGVLCAAKHSVCCHPVLRGSTASYFMPAQASVMHRHDYGNTRCP